ncbi:MAG: colicin V production family protein [Micavibrio aeruginosavorus]|uniref:Colicin V production family protein n=1 Tax=Micavibrio aeruginosavorus TaxID=349221 RepID=A0A2W5MXB4_9BACT|nr:MAG: colicin V production family protein [Micavibrio aeruginosavorus]
MIIDIVVGLVVLASALISFMRGLIREVLTIAGVLGGGMAAVFFGPSLVPTVRTWFGVTDGEDSKKLFDMIPMEIVADITTYGVIFILVVIILSVISHFVSGAAKAVGLGPVDRTLGVFFGVARALIILGLLYLPFHLNMKQEAKDEYLKDSQTLYIIEKVSAAMADYLPDSDKVEKGAKDTANDLIKKKLEEQDLLGGGKKESAKEPEAKLTIVPLSDDKKETEKKSGEGYDDKQRQKLDQLFTEPATNE